MKIKEEIRNNILVTMKNHIDTNAIAVLGTVIAEQFANVDIVELETLPATVGATDQYIFDLFAIKKGQKLAKETCLGYQRTIKELMRYTNKSLTQISEMDVEIYLYKKQKEGNTTTSLNNKRRKISAFYTWMRKAGLITVNPIENIEQYKETKKEVEHLTATEMDRLKGGCISKRDRAVLEWLRCTAMRGGEVVIVNIDQVNWIDGTVTIYGSKGNAYRTVCLDAVAIYHIQKYLEERGEQVGSKNPLFTRSRGDQTIHLKRQSICEIVKKIAKRAGVDKNVYTHLFRKTAATNIVLRGGSEADAGEYLGHKPANVTGRHYIYKSNSHIIAIFNKFVAAV